MSRYGSDDLTIEIDNAGGTLVDMSQYVTETSGIKIEGAIEESTPFGVEWEESLFSGVKFADEVELTGFYDDTASTGPDVIFNAIGATRTLKVTWGGTKTTSAEAIIVSYERIAKVKESTKYTVTLKPTGAITEA